MSGNDKTSWLEGLEHDDDADFDTGVGHDEFTETVQGWGDGAQEGTIGEGKTQLLADEGADKTMIAIGGLGRESSDPHHVTDPVTGWLVVIAGPGTGHAASIGAGMNSVGRSSDERVSLPFGDTLISATDHVRIIYDDETRSFLIVPGTGKNVTRMNGQIVAVPMPLENYTTLQLSKVTRVRFVAFCNTDFDWTDVIDAKPGADG